MFTTVLTNRVNFNKDIEEVRQEWLDVLLSYIGLDVEGLHGADPDAAIEYFADNNVEVINYESIGGLEVRLDGQTVGEWAGADLTLKEAPDGELYFEAEVEHWSVMEDEIA